MVTATPLKTSTGSPGEICPDVLYTLEEISRRANLGRHALRMARRRGLSVKYAHGRGYILGKDLIAYLSEVGK